MYNDILKETLPYYSNYHACGHHTLACSIKSKSAQSFRPYSATSTTTDPSHTLTSSPFQPTSTQQFQQGAICRDFNRHTCRCPNCQFRHICNKPDCGGNHPRSQCPKTSTPLLLSLPSTPVNVINLTAELKHHPDQHYTGSLLHDLQWGCNIGYTGPRSARITQTTHLHPEAISAALAKEVSNGPFHHHPSPISHAPPLG